MTNRQFDLRHAAHASRHFACVLGATSSWRACLDHSLHARMTGQCLSFVRRAAQSESGAASRYWSSSGKPLPSVEGPRCPPPKHRLIPLWYPLVSPWMRLYLSLLPSYSPGILLISPWFPHAISLATSVVPIDFTLVWYSIGIPVVSPSYPLGIPLVAPRSPLIASGVSPGYTRIIPLVPREITSSITIGVATGVPPWMRLGIHVPFHFWDYSGWRLCSPWSPFSTTVGVNLVSASHSLGSPLLSHWYPLILLGPCDVILVSASAVDHNQRVSFCGKTEMFFYSSGSPLPHDTTQPSVRQAASLLQMPCGLCSMSRVSVLAQTPS